MRHSKFQVEKSDSVIRHWEHNAWNAQNAWDYSVRFAKSQVSLDSLFRIVFNLIQSHIVRVSRPHVPRHDVTLISLMMSSDRMSQR